MKKFFQNHRRRICFSLKKKTKEQKLDVKNMNQNPKVFLFDFLI